MHIIQFIEYNTILRIGSDKKKNINDSDMIVNKIGLCCVKLRSSYATSLFAYPNIQTIPVA